MRIVKGQNICLNGVLQGAQLSGKSQGNLFFLQGQGNVREFCKMVREIRKSSKVREKSGNFKIYFHSNPSKYEKKKKKDKGVNL